MNRSSQTSGGGPDAVGCATADTAPAACGALPSAHKHRAVIAWPDGLFAGVVIAICAVVVFIGLAPLVLFEHDVFFLLDNGYRVFQGQVPHRDFESAWGPITYLISAAGLRLSGLKPEGLGYANALFGGLTAVWAYMVTRRRFSRAAAFILGVNTLLLIAAPFSLGWGALNFSPAMVYNRYGFALLGIIMVECAAPGREVAGGFSTGVACGLLAFLKVTYAVVAVPIILVIGGTRVFRRKRLAALCAGAAAVAFLALLYLRFDLSDMLGDLVMAGSGRSRSWRPGEILSLGLGQVAESVPLLLLAIAAGKARLRWFATAVAILALGGFLLSTNHQQRTLPLNGFLAVVMAEGFFRRREREEAGLAETGLVACLTFVCVAPLCFQNGVSMAAAAREKLSPPPGEVVRLASERGASMVFRTSPAETETGGPAYVRVLNEGLDLLRRDTGARDGVLAIDMMNPFNYLLDRPSPTGGLSAGAYNYVISDAAHPSADRWAGSTRFVLVRKYSPNVKDYPVEDYNITGILRIYQPVLDQRFELLEETGHWRLYRKRPFPIPGPAAPPPGTPWTEPASSSHTRG